ncbi:MAG: nitroreductase family protein [Eubacteriales bacterium]|nr:nitroreductase family protein [Eubacteriales bacterium]
MNYFDVIDSRYSVRKYSGREVSDDHLNKILEAGKLAPTSKNLQPQRIFVLKSAGAVEKLAKGCTPCLFNAPVKLLICHDSESSSKRPSDNADVGVTDAAIVTTHMVLAAAALGLGSCWVGLIDPAKIKKEYSLPDNLVPHYLLYIGYAAEGLPADPRHYKRKPISETVEFI